MSNPLGGQQNDVAKGFEKVLNSHGYGFHHSVIKRARELFTAGESPWDFVAAEVPVEVRGAGTRIDFILKRPSTGPDKPDYYLLVECKRANPALSNWCFVRAPYVRPNYHDGVLLWELAYLEPSTDITTIQFPIRPSVYTARVESKYLAYQIALEVKSNAQGDPAGQGRGAIEDAATQVLRGLNGMMEFLKRETRIFPESRKIVLIPAIFTTAKLWVSDASLNSADLTTGNLDLSRTDFREVDWLFYEYNMSPGLKHKEPSNFYTLPSYSIGSTVEREFARTIAVVGPGGITDFLAWVGEVN